MKKLITASLFIVSTIILLCTSCKDCDPPVFSTNIVGIWKHAESGSIVEIKADGSFIDLDALLWDDNSLEELDLKYYEVIREEYVVFTAESSTLFSSSASAWGIDKNACDKIRLSADDGNSVFYLTLDRQ